MKNIYFDILKTLENNGYEAYIVGGYVRDKLLNIKSSDMDMCTNATPKEMLEIFKKNVKVVDEYGAVKLKLKSDVIDITTFRTEEDYVNNKPTKITYVKDLKEDLLRRDFTINTLCLDKNGNVIDLLGAKGDLDNRVLKVVGDNNIKLKEDATRLLRSLRFMTVYDMTLDSKLFNYIVSHQSEFANINYVKRKEELDKLFKHNKVKPFFDFISKYGIDKYLGIQINDFVETGTIIGVWSQLCFDEKYQFTKIEKEQIRKIKELVKSREITKYDIYNYGLYLSLIAGEILGIDKGKINNMYNNLPINNIKDVNITYNEIEVIINKQGKVVGKLLKKLEEEIINGKIENKKEILISRVKEIYYERNERIIAK